MRHIASLFAGIIITPLAWLLIGAGQIGLNPSLYEADAAAPSKFIAMAMLAGAGILLGLLAVTRMSPAGPVLAGFVMAVAFFMFRSEILAFNLPASFAAAKIPASSAVVAGQEGLVLVAAVLLLMSALVPSRWHGPQTEENRDLDTASLAAPKTTESETDPFAGMSPTPSEPGTLGYDDRPVDPFATAERSPYAEDSYGADDMAYGQTRQEPTTQPQSQPYAGQQHADQGFGSDRQYR